MPASSVPTIQQSFKDTVRACATTNVTTLSAPQTIDGVALVAGDRVLLAGQTNPVQNGIYVVRAAAWTRALDASLIPLVGPGHEVHVEAGTLNGQTKWVSTNTGVVTPGTTAMFYTRVHPSYADLSLNPWDPSMLGDNIEREGATSALLQTSGTLYLHGGMVLRAGVTYSALHFFYTTASSGLTHSWAGIVLQAAASISEGGAAAAARAAQTLVAVSADNTAAITAGTFRTYTFASTLTPQQDVPVYFAHLLAASTTVPSTAASPAVSNAALLGAAPVLAGTSGTGKTTPDAVNTVETAPTNITQVAYAYLT